MRQGFPIAMPGMVIGDGMPRHRAKEVLNFLRQIDTTLPGTRDVHLVPDTCATQKTPGVKAWPDKHPRCKRHCRPTGASRRTLVERFFDQITARRIRGGRSSSVDALATAIHDCLAQHSGKPKPFNWTKTAGDIPTRERRAPAKLDEITGNRQDVSDAEH